MPPIPSLNGPNAAAPAAAPTPAGTATPTASPMEIAALELMLADPEIQEIIKNFGGPLEPVSTGNDVEQSIVARYGPDLAARLNQYQAAQQEVQKQPVSWNKSQPVGWDEASRNPSVLARCFKYG